MCPHSSFDCVIIWGPDVTGQVWVREDPIEAAPEGKAFWQPLHTCVSLAFGHVCVSCAGLSCVQRLGVVHKHGRASRTRSGPPGGGGAGQPEDVCVGAPRIHGRCGVRWEDGPGVPRKLAGSSEALPGSLSCYNSV